MADERLVLRPARADDVDELARLEADCWPALLATGPEQIAARIAAYQLGQWVAEADGLLLGYSSAQRIQPEQLQAKPLTYEQLSDHDRFTNSHCDNGSVYQLVGVSSHPKSRGQQIGRQLVDQQIAHAWSLPGIHRVLGFTRPAGRHQVPDQSLDQYLANHSAASTRDAVLAFHLDAGARIVSGHDDFRANDHESLMAAVLIEYSR